MDQGMFKNCVICKIFFKKKTTNFSYFRAGSGHYTAFGTKNSNWYHFNDSTVSVADPETVKHSKAYILFYIQREFRLPPMT